MIYENEEGKLQRGLPQAALDRLKPMMIIPCPDARGAQLLALFEALDERGKLTTLALLATAVKLHPKAEA